MTKSSLESKMTFQRDIILQEFSHNFINNISIRFDF